MARSFADGALDRRVRFVHVDRSMATLALWPEVQALALRSSAIEAVLHLDGEVATAEVPPATQVAPIDLAREARYAATRGAIVYLCGPRRSMTASRSELLAADVAAADIHEEVFVSPSSTPIASSPPPSNGPFSVTFTRSGTVATWTRESGTLLDLAEAVGLALPSHCRAGVCGSCQQRVDVGTTANVMATFAQPANGTTLHCCSVPTSDVTIGC
jgi:ferredoxin-NADP reductase